MNCYIREKIDTYIISILVALFVLFFAKHIEVGVLLPLFSLCGGDCGGDGGGDGGGDSGGGDCWGGDSPNCDTGGSTPFLFTWNGNAFVCDNDILFGKPTSFFATEEEGRRAYEQGNIKGDLYRVRKDVTPKDGKITMQIREIEPEESFIDYLTLFHFQHPGNSELFVGSDYENIYLFDKKELNDKEGIKHQKLFATDHNHNYLSEDTLDPLLHIENKEYFSLEHRMNAGDSITLEGIVENKKQPFFLFLGSYFRTGTFEGIQTTYKQEKFGAQIQKMFSAHLSPKGFMLNSVKIVGLILIFSSMWIFGAVSNVFKNHNTGITENNSDGILARAFGARVAHADVPYGTPYGYQYQYQSPYGTPYGTPGGYSYQYQYQYPSPSYGYQSPYGTPYGSPYSYQYQSPYGSPYGYQYQYQSPYGYQYQYQYPSPYGYQYQYQSPYGYEYEYQSPYGSPSGKTGTKSLVIEYWDGNVYREVDIVEQRLNHGSIQVIPLPQEAVQQDNSISVRITSTKAHSITSAALAAPKKRPKYSKAALKVRTAFHHRTKEDYSSILNSKSSGEYLHTIPTDIVDMEFEMPSPTEENKKETYVVKASGYYTPITEESSLMLGDWLDKLDPASREVFDNLYGHLAHQNNHGDFVAEGINT